MGEYKTIAPAIMAVPKDRPMALSFFPFRDRISNEVVAGILDCNNPIPIQNKNNSFLQKVISGVARPNDMNVYNRHPMRSDIQPPVSFPINAAAPIAISQR